MHNTPWLFLSLLIIILDQLTKYLIQATLVLGDGIRLLSYFNLVYTHNTGAAFSLLHSAGGWQRWFFVLTSLVASTALSVWLLRLKPQQSWLAAALALIIGGAIGNMIDRLRYGYVIDFFDFHVGMWHFATFNVADSAITVGVAMMFIDSLLNKAER